MREEQTLLQLEAISKGYRGMKFSKYLETPDKTIDVEVTDEGETYTVQTIKDGTVERKPVSRAQALKLLAKAGY